MKTVADRMNWPPTRKQAVWVVILVAITASAIVGVTNGLLPGISLALGFSGVLSLIVLLIPVPPRVNVLLRGQENAIPGAADVDLIIGAECVVRPFDIDEIVNAEEREALETMPRQPRPKFPRGAFGGVFDLHQSTVDMLEASSGASDEELEEFRQEVREYGKELRVWLEQLQIARYERLRVFTATARAQEAGQAPADFARMRLRFPDQFEEPARPPEVREPPERPEFVGRYGAVVPQPFRAQQIARGALSHLLHRPDEFRGVAAEYSKENGSIVIDLNIGHLNQHDHRDTPEFSLRTAPPGVYTVKWRISAEGLNPPTEGLIKVEVCEPITGEPIIKLKDALSERENHLLD